MSLGDYTHNHNQLRTELKATREKLVGALDRYADLCLIVRNTHHHTSFKDIQLAGFSWSDVASELLHLSLLHTRLQEAAKHLNRAYELGQARSHSGYSHPINKLPDEILAHVFRFAGAIRPQDSPSTRESSTKLFPQCPDSLAQTCARWRQVALTCSSLWTRIHLASHPTHFDSILDHAKLHVERAGHHSLELYIVDIRDVVDHDLASNIDDLEQFIASIAPRTNSLEIVRSGLYTSEFEKKSLAGILRGCSESFTTLAVRSRDLYRPGYIKPLDNSNKDWDMAVDLSPEQIERGLAHLIVLHASEISPTWSSTAYRGLVDLRLVPNYQSTLECPTINASEFIAILKASPRLRILHFGIHLCFSHALSTDKVKVQLNDLEVLYLSASENHSPEDTGREIQYIIRHITPGKKPLRLTLGRARCWTLSSLKRMKAFFTKSRIVKFCAKRGTPPPVELLDCAPRLTHLVFNGCRYDKTYDFEHGPSRITRLNSWIIQDSLIYTEDIEPLLGQYSAKSYIMSNCRFFAKYDGPLEIAYPDLGDWDRELPSFVQYSPGPSPDPTADWNILD
ncbi:hypothetical protein ACGC1H_001089 [Rhizoctonia solani]